jgi:hypothetical protein
VSLHSHTSYSKESLAFIQEYAERWPVLRWAFERQCKRSRVPVDLAKAYWTPPLTPKLAYETESNQIRNRMEWTVPFGKAIFHLGIHNLPSHQASELVDELHDWTQNPCPQELGELLASLDQIPAVLVVFNHPLWDLCGLGRQRYSEVLNKFLQDNVRFLHAFEMNATRGWNENNAVLQLAECWQRVIVSGGDRHGCEPSGALNLTCAASFPEFVHEIRQEHRSHVLVMPQYAESRCLRTLQTLVDVVGEYPEYPQESQRWDGRVFHPDHITNIDRPVSAYWDTPPAFLERIFFIIRLLENSAVRQTLDKILRQNGIPSRLSGILRKIAS